MIHNLDSFEICDMLPTFKDDYLRLTNNEINISEFYAIISKPITDFIFESENTKKVGKVRIESLTNLFNNLSTKIKAINYKNEIGDDSGVICNLAKNTSKELIDKLNEICSKK